MVKVKPIPLPPVVPMSLTVGIQLPDGSPKLAGIEESYLWIRQPPSGNEPKISNHWRQR